MATSGRGDVVARVADAATIFLAVAAIVVASSMVYGRLVVGSDTDATEADRAVDDWDGLVATSRIVGRRDAAVTIVAFIDYECPFCRRGEPVLRDLMTRYGSNLAIGYKHLPLTSLHPNSYFAARLAECGADQDRFDDVHGFLLGAASLDGVTPEAVAADARVPDSVAFVSCASRVDPVKSVERDLTDADRLGISRTPTYVINGLLLADNPDASEFAEMIEARLDPARPE